jgi:hypothetical protein
MKPEWRRKSTTRQSACRHATCLVGSDGVPTRGRWGAVSYMWVGGGDGGHSGVRVPLSSAPMAMER